MKRKFAAMIMGLTLAAASMGVSATEDVAKTEDRVEVINVENLTEAIDEAAAENEYLSINATAEEKTKKAVGVIKKIEKDGLVVVLSGDPEYSEDEVARIEVDGVEAKNDEVANIEVNDAEANKEAAAEKENVIDHGEEQNEEQDREVVIRLSEDVVLYSVPDTDEGRTLLEMYSKESTELPELESLELTDLKEGDEICIWYDEDGKAAILLVANPETEAKAD